MLKHPSLVWFLGTTLNLGSESLAKSNIESLKEQWPTQYTPPIHKKNRTSKMTGNWEKLLSCQQVHMDHDPYKIPCKNPNFITLHPVIYQEINSTTTMKSHNIIRFRNLLRSQLTTKWSFLARMQVSFEWSGLLPGNWSRLLNWVDGNAKRVVRKAWFGQDGVGEILKETFLWETGEEHTLKVKAMKWNKGEVLGSWGFGAPHPQRPIPSLLNADRS